MKNELQIFFAALMFYTRIPCPKWVGYSEEQLKKSVRYLPLVGWIVGGMSGLVLLVCLQVLPLSLSLLLAMVTGVFITGSFHEDGLADVCDGFGGGWTKEKILAIMKDSRLGTYGAVALICILGVKFLALSTILELPHFNNYPLEALVMIVFICGHSLSRFIALTTVLSHQYVRENDDSKAKSQLKGDLKWGEFTTLCALFWGVLPLMFFQTPWVIFLIVLMWLTKWLMARFFFKWIGGYTGDCLGAIQQVSEVVFYLGLIGIWKFI